MIYHYPHPEYFAGWEKPDLRKHSGNIVLWGAGKVGEVAAHCLHKLGVRFAAFCDIAENRWGTEYCGHKVISPAELKERHADSMVLITNAFPASTYSALEELGFKEVYDCASFLVEVDFEDYAYALSPEFAFRITEDYLRNILLFRRRGPFIERLAVIINQNCTLRCRHCDGYIPYVEHPKNYKLSVIKECFEKINESVGGIGAIDVLGGEPLLHREIYGILEYFLRLDSINRVVLISNGTIVPETKLLKLMENEKFRLRLSDYGKLSSKLEELRHILTSRGIRFEITNYQQWDSLPELRWTNEIARQLDMKFTDCTTSALYIQNGKLFYCTVAAGLTHVGKQVLPPSDNNYLDLYDEHEAMIPNAAERILAFCNRLRARKHIDACRYCNGSHCLQFRDKVPVAEQAEGRLSLDDLYIRE
jgi:organic radical activating enzyme